MKSKRGTKQEPEPKPTTRPRYVSAKVKADNGGFTILGILKDGSTRFCGWLKNEEQAHALADQLTGINSNLEENNG